MTSKELATYGAKGGAVTAAESPAKAAALAALHASRRGVRVNPDSPERERLLARVVEILRAPARGEISIRQLAAHCRVSEKAARNWLNGTDWPSPRALRRIAAWVELHR